MCLISFGSIKTFRGHFKQVPTVAKIRTGHTSPPGGCQQLKRSLVTGCGISRPTELITSEGYQDGCALFPKDCVLQDTTIGFMFFVTVNAFAALTICHTGARVEVVFSSSLAPTKSSSSSLMTYTFLKIDCSEHKCAIYGASHTASFNFYLKENLSIVFLPPPPRSPCSPLVCGMTFYAKPGFVSTIIKCK